MENPLRTVKIFVRLLDEGTEVFRPTQAIENDDGTFTLVPSVDYDTEDESWEFPPGSIVRAEKKLQRSEMHLIAAKYDPDRNH